MRPPQASDNGQDAKGDAAREDRLRGWMAAYGPALRRYFAKRAGPADADDLTQDVFVRLYVRGETGFVDDNVEGYLFRIAASVLVDRSRRRGLGVRVAGEPEPVEELSPERVLQGKQSLARLIVAMQGLPPTMRRAFMLHRFEDVTYAAIARRRGVSTKAVEKLIGQALKRLAAAMEERP